ncbi:hypothetical protein NGRA_0007 [Nosema granulosis]|uniref:Uncharacterized protein n=1 Tax=Nosema granulosis TaxID=83296 RepID=A0A9P6H257_9MICR|nr:hypothetical protein NGRA_0007 [Nosema granulosis]
MPNQKPEKIIKTIFKTSQEIEVICTDIFKKVELAKMDVIKEFNPYIQPKKNLDSLLSFYGAFQKAYETISKMSQTVYSLYGENLEVIDLQSIMKNGLLGILKTIKIEQNNILDYAGVKIVDSLLASSNDLLEIVISKIYPVYFANLFNKTASDDDMKSISEFLMVFSDKKRFLGKYSNAILNKTSYDDIGLDRRKLLERTKDIEGHISSVNKYNIKILGGANAQIINRGLNKLLLINLKKIIADILIVVEKEENMASVPFCMVLNSHLRQSEEAEIKEVEELYVFKNEINKIVCNIFLAFVENLKTIQQPNKFCDIETIALNLKRSLDSLEDNKNVSRVFIKNYGPFFKAKTVDELAKSFSEMVLNKVISLSKQLDTIKRSIYLINNFYTLKCFVDDVDGLNIKEEIEKSSTMIIEVWKSELDSKSGRNFSNFVESNLESFKSYYLPEEVRREIVPKIKTIVWENILTKGYQGNENALNDSINDIFTGK